MPALVLLALLLSGPAFAYSASETAEASSWTFDPWIVTCLVVPLLCFGVGILRLAERARRSVRPYLAKAAIFGLAWLSLAGALVSPLHELGERLFTFHMIEHEIVMAIAAPLFAFARPIGPLMWSLPHRPRIAVRRWMRSPGVRRSWRWLVSGAVATSLHAVAIWGWHAPPLFDAAVQSPLLHRLQHLSFFVTALLFWWSMMWRSDRGAAAWHVFVTMMHTGILGALMALAPAVLYAAQTHHAAEWGLTPLEDQQLAGVVMWIPAGTIYAGAAFGLMALWIRDAGKGGDHVPHPG